jgi:membrane associated rhomboid family serine protease
MFLRTTTYQQRRCCTAVLLFSLSSLWFVQCLRVPRRRTAASEHNFSSSRVLQELRGGNLNYNRNQHIELNPQYESKSPSPSPPVHTNEHQEWLRLQLQQQLQIQQPQNTHAFQRQVANESIFSRMRQYMINLKKASPSVFWTALSCIGIFILWQIPLAIPLLLKSCVCSRSNIIQAAGLPLFLAAISHASLYHLLANLFTLCSIAPGVYSVTKSPLWPLLLGSAVFSNAVFVGLRRSGSCLGLSGVTMSVIAVQARGVPNRVYSFLLGGILPISLPANQILQALLAVSLVGSFMRNSRIAHLVHLAGLIFGVLYYELYVNRPGRRRAHLSSVSWS